MSASCAFSSTVRRTNDTSLPARRRVSIVSSATAASVLACSLARVVACGRAGWRASAGCSGRIGAGVAGWSGSVVAPSASSSSSSSPAGGCWPPKKISAPIPLTEARLGTVHLHGELVERPGDLVAAVVLEDRLAGHRRLFDLDGVLDHHVVHLPGEAGPDLVQHFVGVDGAAVEFGRQDARQAQVAV